MGRQDEPDLCLSLLGTPRGFVIETDVRLLPDSNRKFRGVVVVVLRFVDPFF